MSDAHGHGSPGHDDHGHDDPGHDDHDDHAAGGHDADPNAGVVVGTPPTPAWVLTAVLIGFVTLVASVILAVAMES